MGHHTAEGYEDWLKVDCASRTSVSQTAAKKVATHLISFPISQRVNQKLSKLSFKGHKVRFWQHQALAEKGQPGVAPSPLHIRGDTGEDHIRWRPAS